MRSLPEGQQMARVNLPKDQWDSFRELAARERRSVATYLGRLVQKEIRRASRRKPREVHKVELRRKASRADDPPDEVDENWVPPWEI